MRDWQICLSIKSGLSYFLLVTNLNNGFTIIIIGLLSNKKNDIDNIFISYINSLYTCILAIEVPNIKIVPIRRNSSLYTIETTFHHDETLVPCHMQQGVLLHYIMYYAIILI